MANISKIKNEPSDWNTNLSSNGTPTSYKIDTSTQCNVIPVEGLENILPKPDLQPVNIKLPTYKGSKIPVVNNSFKVSFTVVDSDSVPILRLKTSQDLQLIQRICRIEINCEIFLIVSEK